MQRTLKCHYIVKTKQFSNALHCKNTICKWGKTVKNFLKDIVSKNKFQFYFSTKLILFEGCLDSFTGKQECNTIDQ